MTVAETIDRPLPHNLDAERNLLGAVLLDNSALFKIIPVLGGDDFFLPQHRVIYHAMQSMAATGKPIEITLLMDTLNASDKLDAAGGAPYLSQLTNGLPRSTNVEHYASIVRSKKQSRQLIYFAAHLEERAYGEEPETIAEESIAELLAAVSDEGAMIKSRAWNDVAKSAVDQLISAKLDPQKSGRMLFGLKELDKITSGLRRKELCLIVAPTSNGKSQIASQLAVNASAGGFRTLYFTAEMTGEEVALREIAYRAGVKFYFTQRPEQLTTEELVRMTEASSEPVTIQIADQDITPSRVWALSEAHKRSSGLDLVIVDYDQLVIEAGMDPKADDDSVFRHQRNFIFSAKRMAQRLDVCFVLLCQLRKIPPRVAKGTNPHLDDIWGDSSVRNTPHLILWLVREFFQHDMDPEFERKAKVYVLKSRNGRTGVVPLEFDPERLRFLDAPKVEEVRTFGFGQDS
jgi:replicative DNA helicase